MTETQAPASRGGGKAILVKHQRLVVGTFNPGKAREMVELLSGLPLEVVSLADCPEARPVEETGETFEENAAQKASGFARQLGALVVADDSGLEVDALAGAPGVHSARFGGVLGDGERIAYLLQRIRHVPDSERGARFVAVLVLATPDGDVHSVRGECRGRILHGPRGDGGHGYDPVFLADDLGMTFAEAEPSAKQRVSHRGRALAALLAWLQGPGEGFGEAWR